MLLLRIVIVFCKPHSFHLYTAFSLLVVWVFSYAAFSESRIIISSMMFRYRNFMGTFYAVFFRKTHEYSFMLFSFKNCMNFSSMLTFLRRPHGCLFVLFSSENRMNFSSMLFPSENRMNFSSMLFPSEKWQELFSCDVSFRKPHELFFYAVSFQNDVTIPFMLFSSKTGMKFSSMLFSSKNRVIYSFILFFLKYAGFTVNPHSPHILCCMLFSILYCVRKTS